MPLAASRVPGPGVAGSRARRLTALAVLVAALVLGFAPTASAHATVVSTTPGDGQVLTTAPTRVSVRFAEPVELQFGALRVFSPSGARVDTGTPAHPPGHADTVDVGLESGLGHGTYTVGWRVISADSHPVSGAFTFSVGATSAVSPASGALDDGGASVSVRVLYGVVRGLAYGFFAVLAGGTGFLIVCWPSGAAAVRGRVVVAVGWAGLAASTLAALGLQGPYDAGLGLSRVLDAAILRTTASTRLGTALTVRLALLAVAAPGLLVLLPRLAGASVRLRVSAGAVGAVLAAGMAVTWAAADHSGTGSQTALALPVDVTHVLAMAMWIGGLVLLATTVLRPVVPRSAARVPAMAGAGAPAGGGIGGAGLGTEPSGGEASTRIAEAVRRFSTIAATCVSVLVVTGVYQAWRQIGTLAALTGTAYGRLLLLKLLGVGLLIGLGYLARLWIAHHLGPEKAAGATAAAAGTPDVAALRQLRRSVGMEVVVASAVLALTTALVQARPARSAYAAPVSADVAFDAGGPAGRGIVEVFVTPARPGPDTVHLEVVTPDGRPKAVPGLTASFSLPARQLGPLPVALAPDGSGHSTGTVTIPLSGPWRLAVTVRTDDVDETTLVIPISVH